MKFISYFYCGIVMMVLSISGMAQKATSEHEKIVTLLQEAAQAQSEKNFDKAIERYEAVLSDSQSSLAQKVDAVIRKGTILLAEKKAEEVKVLYLEFLAKTEFQNVPERADMLLAFARVYDSWKEHAKAQEMYEEVFQDPATSHQNRIIAWRGVGQALLAQNQYEKARVSYERILMFPDLKPAEKVMGLSAIANAYEQEGNLSKAETEYLKAVQTEDHNERKAGLLELIAFYKRQNNWEGFTKTLEELHETEGEISLSVLQEYILFAQTMGKKDEERKGLDKILEMPNLTDQILSKFIHQKLVLLASLRDIPELKQFIAEMGKRSLTPPQQALLSLLTEVLSVSNKDFSKLKTLLPISLNVEEQADIYFEAGKIMMYLRDSDAARFLAEKGESLFKKNPIQLYEVPFAEHAPRGVSAWKNSPFVRDTTRRENRFEEYNKKAAALLINDVNVVRNVNSEEPAKNVPIAFYMAADAFGLSVYIEYRDDEAELVQAGLVSGGTLEIAWDPKKDAPYFHFIIEVPSGKINFMDWTSPNPHYRVLDDYLISEVSPIPEGFGIALVFPWEVIYDKLPQKEDQSPFGLINFGRNGAFTWGSGQVHELNKFGKISFPEIEKNLPAIHRKIVLRAYAKFKEHAEIAEAIWNDPEKGDTVFYKTILQPEITRLQEEGKQISSTISVNDSERLFQEMVPAWMEFEYRVAEMRTRYLKKQFMTP